VDRFWNELDSATDGIASFPERHHYDPSGLRRSNLVKFPYHVLFEQRLDCVRIMHGRIFLLKQQSMTTIGCCDPANL